MKDRLPRPVSERERQRIVQLATTTELTLEQIGVRIGRARDLVAKVLRAAGVQRAKQRGY